mgnify:CR=1 FL=1
MKRIAIFCDGTWNRSDGEFLTNVVKLSLAVARTAKDGTIYAFDADTGEELWAMRLPGGIGSEGIPAMYELNGKQYLVVSATTPHRGLGEPSAQGDPTRHYVAFALPD